jgi:hypothetical protein
MLRLGPQWTSLSPFWSRKVSRCLVSSVGYVGGLAVDPTSVEMLTLVTVGPAMVEKDVSVTCVLRD